MLHERMKLAASMTVGLLGAWLWFTGVAHGGTVAGLVPDRRPVDAPTVAETPVSPDKLSHALYGVVQPIPGNLATIAATGRWFVPLRSPGMHAPYDLRGWHARPLPAVHDAAATARP